MFATAPTMTSSPSYPEVSLSSSKMPSGAVPKSDSVRILVNEMRPMNRSVASVFRQTAARLTEAGRFATLSVLSRYTEQQPRTTEQ